MAPNKDDDDLPADWQQQDSLRSWELYIAIKRAQYLLDQHTGKDDSDVGVEGKRRQEVLLL